MIRLISQRHAPVLPVACAPFYSGTYSVVGSVRLWVAGQSLETSSRGKERMSGFQWLGYPNYEQGNKLLKGYGGC